MTSSFNLQYIYERWLLSSLCYICDVLRDLVYHLHNLKKREKHPWDSVTFSKKPATLLNVKLLHGCFSSFLIVQMVPNRAMHHINIAPFTSVRMT